MTIKSNISFLLQKLFPGRPTVSSASEIASSPCSASGFSHSGEDAVERGVFAFFDKNGDGKISPVELQSCLMDLGSELSNEDAEAMIAFSDSDGDGILNADDFRRLMDDTTGGTDELMKAFEMYATKPGSGCISPGSLKRMLSRLGESKSIEECKVMIGYFDLNGDGLLSFEEFCHMMHKGVAAVHSQ